MANIGYARVSTEDQHLDAQHAALANAGCSQVFSEKVTGTRRDRPELERAIDFCRRGDVLVVARLDRMGRSMQHLIESVTDLDRRGIGFRSLYESIDTTSSTGRLVFHILAALAEFERDLIVERTKAGLSAARARGSVLGRKPALSHDQIEVVRVLHASGEHTVARIAEVVGVSRATVYRALAAHDPSAPDARMGSFSG